MAKIERVVKVGKTKVVPISHKILAVFIFLLLLTTAATNMISALLSNHKISELSATILSDQLKQVFMTATNQFQVYQYSQDKNASIDVIKKVANSGLEYKNSVSCAFDTEGKMLYIVSEGADWKDFPDRQVLNHLNDQLVIGNNSGLISFESMEGEYQGVYKFQKDWKLYFLRADLVYDT